MQKSKQIIIGNISMSEEGWKWWIEYWEKDSVSFYNWLQKIKAITIIKSNIEPAGV